jgi:hypothetical protein
LIWAALPAVAVRTRQPEARAMTRKDRRFMWWSFESECCARRLLRSI